jgi:VanZ family protein
VLENAPMHLPDPKSNPNATLIAVWTSVAAVMALAVIWGAVQLDDPLSHYIPTDTARHILAFGAIGLCAALMPTARSRVMALGVVLGFAAIVEIIQIPVPGRTASWGDLFASSVGAFGGFGLGAAAINLAETLRGPINALSKASTRPS